MKPILLNTILAAAWLLGSPGIVLAGPIEQKGTDPYVTHFIFREALSSLFSPSDVWLRRLR